jgi:hypothetical protein
MTENRTSKAVQEWVGNFLRHSSKELAIAEKYLRMENALEEYVKTATDDSYEIAKEALSFDPLK